jgi:hypothetical protein
VLVVIALLGMPIAAFLMLALWYALLTKLASARSVDAWTASSASAEEARAT